MSLTFNQTFCQMFNIIHIVFCQNGLLNMIWFSYFSNIEAPSVVGRYNIMFVYIDEKTEISSSVVSYINAIFCMLVFLQHNKNSSFLNILFYFIAGVIKMERLLKCIPLIKQRGPSNFTLYKMNKLWLCTMIHKSICM